MENSKFTTLLLVDDNETTLFLNEDVVSEIFPNAEIVTYQSAQTLLNEFESKYTSQDKQLLLFLDLNMDLSGYDFLQELEDELESLPNLEVIILTSSRLKRDVERANVFGCVKGYIEKPLTTEKINQILL
jgi:CheY-like chemotaxis protein